MTQEEKQLLLQDLCALLPYGFKYQVQYGDTSVRDVKKFMLDGEYSLFDAWMVQEIKPYLRPMSSMTEKEYETFPIPYSFDSFSNWNNTILSEVIEGAQIFIGIDEITEIIDWLNSHHFDYRGLIEKGLALEAPDGMYNTKTE